MGRDDSGQGERGEVETLEKGAKEGRFLTRIGNGELPDTLDISAWTPTQLAVLVWYAMPSDRRIPSTAKRLAADLGVPESTLYHWQGQAGWSAAVAEIARHNMTKRLPHLYGSLTKQAEAGDIKALRLAFELMGMVGAEGKAATANVAVQLVIAQDSGGAEESGSGRRLMVVDGERGDGNSRGTGEGERDEHE
jgi:hypothetical protein